MRSAPAATLPVTQYHNLDILPSIRPDLDNATPPVLGLIQTENHNNALEWSRAMEVQIWLVRDPSASVRCKAATVVCRAS
ncbi:hypothetical protein KC19_4G176100 [Ceratodon purpureus]|uniref:Uncharacterized protein n=1 Tax=Ceratodon purpureus TaxID=3225 RepID=A0A8T0I9V5_CERPU|nr:hypothetical protein KC19_4G176100 [Ceratodon purpureus]